VLWALYQLLAAHLETSNAQRGAFARVDVVPIHPRRLADSFDGENEPLVFSGRLVVLDLSAQWSSNSLSVAVLSAVAAAQQVVARRAELGYSCSTKRGHFSATSTLFDGYAVRGSWRALEDSLMSWCCIVGVMSPRG